MIEYLPHNANSGFQHYRFTSNNNSFNYEFYFDIYCVGSIYVKHLEQGTGEGWWCTYKYDTEGNIIPRRDFESDYKLYKLPKLILTFEFKIALKKFINLLKIYK